MSQLLSKIIITLLTLLGIAILVGEIFNLHIYFPINLAENNEIPYNNLIAIRLAILATFSFYGLMHFLHGSKEVYPIHFLKTFLFMLSIMGLTVFLKGYAEVSLKQWLLLLFFFCVATILHLATDSKNRRFGKK